MSKKRFLVVFFCILMAPYHLTAFAHTGGGGAGQEPNLNPLYGAIAATLGAYWVGSTFKEFDVAGKLPSIILNQSGKYEGPLSHANFGGKSLMAGQFPYLLTVSAPPAANLPLVFSVAAEDLPFYAAASTGSIVEVVDAPRSVSVTVFKDYGREEVPNVTNLVAQATHRAAQIYPTLKNVNVDIVVTPVSIINGVGLGGSIVFDNPDVMGVGKSLGTGWGYTALKYTVRFMGAKDALPEADGD